MADMLGHILESIGGGGILGGIGEALLDKDKPRPEDAMKSYKTGTMRVPKTGPAVLHKDEAVLNKHDATHYRSAMDHLGGGEHKPKKEVKEIRTRKGKSGGYIHEHHHTHPEHHAMEEHTSPDQDAMVSHMMENMGSANPGEAEADAGQSGMDAGAPPQGTPQVPQAE